MARIFQILSFGYDRSLMATRSLLLRNSGFVVQEAFSRQQAVSMASSDLVDVLLICHTVPENESQALVSAVRKQRLMMPILCVRETEYSAPFRDGCTAVSSTPPGASGSRPFGSKGSARAKVKSWLAEEPGNSVNHAIRNNK